MPSRPKVREVDLFLFKNVTKIDQVFKNDNGKTISVVPGGTILLSEKLGAKFFGILEQVKEGPGGPVDGPTDTTRVRDDLVED